MILPECFGSPELEFQPNVLNLMLRRTPDLIPEDQVKLQTFVKIFEESEVWTVFIWWCESIQIYSFGDLNVETLSDLFYIRSCFLIHCFLYLFKEVILNVPLVVKVKEVRNLTEAIVWVHLRSDHMSHSQTGNSWKDLQILHGNFF